MILIGQLDSPFLRRVAVTMNVYGVPFERRSLSVFANFADVKNINPLGRVPALVLDDNDIVFDSQMIIDYLDELAGPAKALTPPSGVGRRRVLQRVAMALGIAEKVAALNIETKRRSSVTIDPAIVGRFQSQISSALKWLEAIKPDPWLAGPAMTQADVTAAAMLTHLVNRQAQLFDPAQYPALDALRRRAEDLPVFQASPFQDS